MIASNLYLWIDLFTLLGPLILSFDKRVSFYKKWIALFPSILVMMAVFIPWDIYFTVNGVWGFNESYLTGFELFNLPIEEWLFFIVVPYACVFIYECLVSYTKDYFLVASQRFFLILALVLLVIGLFNYENSYTVVNFVGASIIIFLSTFFIKENLGYAMFAYIVGLIPFILVNGVLTGSFLKEPIVWYNNDKNLSIRIFTIPIEDTIYFLFFFLLVLIPYEKIKSSYLIQRNP